MAVDYRAYPILCVDENTSLLALRRALEPHFDVLNADDGADALRILVERDVAILLAAERMPDMAGAELCARAREIRPETVRMIAGAGTDPACATDAINRGAVAHYVVRPWRDAELVDVLRDHLCAVVAQRSVRNLEKSLRVGTAAATAYTIRRGVGHEVANVLHALQFNTELAHGELATAMRADVDPERARACANTARQCTGDLLVSLEQLHGIVAGLRRRDAVRDGAAAHCDAAHTVDAAVRMLRSDVERIARLTLLVDASPTVALDRVALAQIVVSLVDNASQVIEPGAPHDHEISVRVAVDGDFCVVSVSDCGPGISAALHERIFGPRSTAWMGGSGVGLAIVRDIVKQARGTMTAENRSERGACFTVRLPIVAPEHTSVRPP